MKQTIVSTLVEYLGISITPRSDEVDDWDNYRIQDPDIAYIPEMKRYVMMCNMTDKAAP
jgi:hypothetical protein